MNREKYGEGGYSHIMKPEVSFRDALRIYYREKVWYNQNFSTSNFNDITKIWKIKHIVSRKSSWRFPTDEVKSKYLSVTTSRINNTRRAFARWHLRLCFTQNFIEIDVAYQKLFKLKNGPESRENSLYFAIPPTKARTHRTLMNKICGALRVEIWIGIQPSLGPFSRIKSGPRPRKLFGR